MIRCSPQRISATSLKLVNGKPKPDLPFNLPSSANYIFVGISTPCLTSWWMWSFSQNSGMQGANHGISRCHVEITLFWKMAWSEIASAGKKFSQVWWKSLLDIVALKFFARCLVDFQHGCPQSTHVASLRSDIFTIWKHIMKNYF